MVVLKPSGPTTPAEATAVVPGEIVALVVDTLLVDTDVVDTLLAVPDVVDADTLDVETKRDALDVEL